jgi:hypothetical protein
MAAYFASGADAQVTDSVPRLAGHPARSIEEFLAEHADAFAGRRWPGLARLVPSIPAPGGL